MKSEKWIRKELESLENLLTMESGWHLEWRISYTIRMLRRILED